MVNWAFCYLLNDMGFKQILWYGAGHLKKQRLHAKFPAKHFHFNQVKMPMSSCKSRYLNIFPRNSITIANWGMFCFIAQVEINCVPVGTASVVIKNVEIGSSSSVNHRKMWRALYLTAPINMPQFLETFNNCKHKYISFPSSLLRVISKMPISL